MRNVRGQAVAPREPFNKLLPISLLPHRRTYLITPQRVCLRLAALLWPSDPLVTQTSLIVWSRHINVVLRNDWDYSGRVLSLGSLYAPLSKTHTSRGLKPICASVKVTQCSTCPLPSRLGRISPEPLVPILSIFPRPKDGSGIM